MQLYNLEAKRRSSEEATIFTSSCLRVFASDDKL
jgi:hypothetical protein